MSSEVKKVPWRVGRARLLKLAQYLRESVPKEQFDMTTWVGSDWKGKSDFSCGTTACALGWACTMPTFRRLGLKINFEEHKYARYTHYMSLFSFDGKHMNGMDVAERIFGLTNSEAHFLFEPDNDLYDKNGRQILHSCDIVTPVQEAKLIEKFVKLKDQGKI